MKMETVIVISDGDKVGSIVEASAPFQDGTIDDTVGLRLTFANSKTDLSWPHVEHELSFVLCNKEAVKQ